MSPTYSYVITPVYYLKEFHKDDANLVEEDEEKSVEVVAYWKKTWRGNWFPTIPYPGTESAKNEGFKFCQGKYESKEIFKICLSDLEGLEEYFREEEEL